MIRAGKPYNWGNFINKVKTELNTNNWVNQYSPTPESTPQVAPIQQTVSEWAKDAQEFVIASDISDGMRPKDPVTREEVWTMLQRAFTMGL